jgi:hypothetical protein
MSKWRAHVVSSQGGPKFSHGRGPSAANCESFFVVLLQIFHLLARFLRGRMGVT